MISYGYKLCVARGFGLVVYMVHNGNASWPGILFIQVLLVTWIVSYS